MLASTAAHPQTPTNGRSGSSIKANRLAQAEAVRVSQQVWSLGMGGLRFSLTPTLALSCAFGGLDVGWWKNWVGGSSPLLSCRWTSEAEPQFLGMLLSL